jgi:hypothetical protein
MMKYGAPPAISRLATSMAHATPISRLALVGWLDLELDGEFGWQVFAAQLEHTAWARRACVLHMPVRIGNSTPTTFAR